MAAEASRLVRSNCAPATRVRPDSDQNYARQRNGAEGHLQTFKNRHVSCRCGHPLRELCIKLWQEHDAILITAGRVHYDPRAGLTALIARGMRHIDGNEALLALVHQYALLQIIAVIDRAFAFEHMGDSLNLGLAGLYYGYTVVCYPRHVCLPPTVTLSELVTADARRQLSVAVGRLVGCGSVADIHELNRHVRFTSESGYQSRQIWMCPRRLLWCLSAANQPLCDPGGRFRIGAIGMDQHQRHGAFHK